jgi:hypothetical protein
MRSLTFFAALCSGLVTLDCDAAESPRSVDVFLESSCPSVAPQLKAHASPLVAIGELVISSVIGSAVDAAGAYLTGAATTKSVALRGVTSDLFYELSQTGALRLKRPSGCLVMVARGDEPLRPWFDRARTRSAPLRAYDRLPKFYFEAAFERPAEAAQSLVIRPMLLHIGSFQESSGWSYKDTRKYSVALTLRNLEDGKPFGSVSFAFDDLTPRTLGTSTVIHIRPDGTTLDDSTIQANLNAAALEQRVDWFPVGAAIDGASKAQALVAAPYLKAAKLANGVQSDPPTPLAEWAVRTEVALGDAEKAFVSRLQSFCDSLAKKPASDQVKDTRCPVSHLQATNDLEEARSSLQAKMDKEWAGKFIARHPAECVKNAGNQQVCLPASPQPSQLGAYAWEATVVETRDPTSFATALASAFAAKKESLKSGLEDELLPSKREQARQSAEAAQRDALNQFRLAMLDVDKAQAKLDEATTQPRSAQVALQAELLKAKIAANSAARAAKQAEPFSI